ncbi:replication initiator protein A [Leuconostocaceae bacterium ESL0958]|nr:replication initiator protein A [Leuconostocaceae bacterium ESL0958]
MERINLSQIKTFEQFYRLPKVFFTSDKYKDMRLESKTAYAILRDRFELSIQNGWVDNQGDVFFVFTVDELGALLSCGKNKVIGIKKDLSQHGLLEEERQGLNRPNRLYLGTIASDIEAKKSSEPLVKAEVSKSNFRGFENQTSGGLKNKLQEVSKSNPNDTEYSDTDLNDDDDEYTYTAPERNTSVSQSSCSDELARLYANETGQTLNPAQVKKLKNLGDWFGVEKTQAAIKTAAEAGGQSLRYVEVVLNNAAKEQAALGHLNQQSPDQVHKPKVPAFKFAGF